MEIIDGNIYPLILDHGPHHHLSFLYHYTDPAQVINAPTIQYVSAGDSTVLNCSTTFPRHLIFITWLYNSSTISNVINSASLEHAGQYNCLIYETVTSVVIYRANIQLVVIGK